MTCKLKFQLLFSLLALLVAACSNSSRSPIDLDERYQKIKTIQSTADCSGPGILYTTEVHSTLDGYTYFHQKYKGRMETFEAILPNAKQGYKLSFDKSIQDSIPFGERGVIKSHEFHKLSARPELFFSQITEQTEVTPSPTHQWYSGLDQSDHPVKLRYNKAQKTIDRIEMRNMLDTSQTINISYQTWVDTEFGPLSKDVEIIQGNRDTFKFHFTQVNINDSSFRKRTAKGMGSGK
ncbi:MAG: hypothetical protein AAF990_01895 [Bacteroidota bacterium]